MDIVARYRKLVAVALLVLSGLAVLVATSAAPVAAGGGGVPKGDAFYVPPEPLAKAKPGTIIRSTPIADAPAGRGRGRSCTTRVRSTAATSPVSGVVVAPDGPGAARRAGRGRRWAHGATGLADVCAPSKQSDIVSGSGVQQELGRFCRRSSRCSEHFLDAGYVVAATDYEGLGTPGLHPFLVGESEGRSVLDAARAAQGLKAAGAASKVLVFGHSQGGHAALFAGELAASYAPDLRVLGIATEAPVMTDVEHALPIIGSVDAANPIIVMLVEAFHAAYPQFDDTSLLSADALAQAPIVDQKCFMRHRRRPTRVSPDLALAHNPLDVPAMATILRTNSAANRPAGAPLLVVQGTADMDVPQVISDAVRSEGVRDG